MSNDKRNGLSLAYPSVKDGNFSDLPQGYFSAPMKPLGHLEPRSSSFNNLIKSVKNMKLDFHHNGLYSTMPWTLGLA